MSAIIYRLTNTINQKTYIGLTTKTLDERWRQHINSTACGSSCYVHNAIRKYGADAFTREVLEETTTDLMNERERHWIAEGAPEYNMTAGGEGVVGYFHSPETRAKMSAALRGKPKSAEHRANMRKPKTPETRAKMSAAQRNMSPETRAKISATKRGKPKSPEHRIKIGDAKRGKTLTPEHRAKISATLRKRYSK